MYVNVVSARSGPPQRTQKQNEKTRDVAPFAALAAPRRG
jgi:hypothetical protein